MMTSGGESGLSARNSRQHIAGFGVLYHRVGDKAGRRSGLGGGIQPFALMRRNLQHRRPVWLPVLRRVEQRKSRYSIRSCGSGDYGAKSAPPRSR